MRIGVRSKLAGIAFAFAALTIVHPVPLALGQDAKPAEGQQAPNPAEEKEKAEKERRDLLRKGERSKRELQMAEMRLQKAKLQIDITEKQNALAIDKAKKDLELAQRKLRNFKEKGRPERIERADLGLAFAQDGLKEAEQELEQLEKMYKDDQFADMTKEIVLERGRRRLERSRKSLQIETAAVAVLKGETLPIEELEQETGVKDKTEALDKLQIDQSLGMIDLRIGLISAEGEVLRIRDDITDGERDLKDFDRKQAEKAAKAASQPSSAAASQPAK